MSCVYSLFPVISLSDRIVQLLKMHPGTRNYQLRYRVVGVEFMSILCCHLPRLLHLQRMQILRNRSRQVPISYYLELMKLWSHWFNAVNHDGLALISMKGQCQMHPGIKTSGQPINKKSPLMNTLRTSLTQPLKIWITKRRQAWWYFFLILSRILTGSWGLW